MTRTATKPKIETERGELLALLDGETVTKHDVRRFIDYFRDRGIDRTALAKKMRIAYLYLGAVSYGTKRVNPQFRERMRAALHGRQPSLDRRRAKVTTGRMRPLTRAELFASLAKSDFTPADLSSVVNYFKANAISRTALAARLGISYEHLVNLLYGSNPISPQFRERIRRALDAPLSDPEPEQPPNVPGPGVQAASEADGPIPPPQGATLDAHLRVYLLERDLAPRSAEQMHVVVRQFSAFLGRPATLGDFTDALVNRFLAGLVASGKSKIRQRGIRTQLLCLWRHAFEVEAIDKPPMRVRKIKVERRLPQAWTQEQVRRLIVSARAERGRFRNAAVERAAFWEAFVRVGYDTGLRLGDLRRLRLIQIAEDGTFTVVQHKTGDGIACHLSPETLAAIDRTAPAGREFIFGSVLTTRWSIASQFRRIVKRAGLTGSAKWLRRSGATAVEQLVPGGASAFLGHRTPGLAAQHYIDPTHIQRMKSAPPPLGLVDGKGGAA